MAYRLKGKGIKIISNAIYIGAPGWLCISDNKEFILLDGNTTKQEVDLFLFGIFIYNSSICITDNSSESLQNLLDAFNSDEVVLSGGPLFYENDTRILPSCCCGLEQWHEVVTGICNKRNVWLGHDPFPVIEYGDNLTTIWSDDCLGIYGAAKPKDNLNSIEFLVDGLDCCLDKLRGDIKAFVTIPFCNRLNEIDHYMADDLMFAVMKWLNIA